MIRKSVLPVIAAMLLLVCLIGCGKSDSAKSSTPDAPAANGGASAIEQDAKTAAIAEIQKHYTKATDGWITARVSGSAYAPVHFLRQVRDITIDEVNANPQTDSDRLNGVVWSGQITFKMLPCREAGDDGMLLDGLGDISPTRQHGRWTAWAQYMPEPIQLQKINGQWKVTQDTWFLRGQIPTDADYQRAGVR